MNISFRNASLILRRTLPTVLLIIGAFLSALGSLPGRARAQTKAVPARSQGTANALPGWLRPSRHAVALGISAGNFGISSRHDAQELRSLSKISPLHFQ